MANLNRWLSVVEQSFTFAKCSVEELCVVFSKNLKPPTQVIKANNAILLGQVS